MRGVGTQRDAGPSRPSISRAHLVQFSRLDLGRPGAAQRGPIVRDEIDLRGALLSTSVEFLERSEPRERQTHLAPEGASSVRAVCWCRALARWGRGLGLSYTTYRTV